MKTKLFLTLALLCTIVQGVWAWDGEGTSANPYKIKSSADWKQLADDVNGGNSYSGKYFEMTADIDADGVSVGKDGKPFSGTFDGYSHTLTYNRGVGTSQHTEYVDDFCAPFSLLEGATVRHLKVKGSIFSSHKWAAGVASRIDGAKATTIDDCHVSSTLNGSSDLRADATFGGIVGVVEGTCQASPVIKNCSFTGSFRSYVNCCGGMVGYTSMPVTFKHCIFDPASTTSADGCATYIRTPENIVCPMEECYFTLAFGLSQGEGVFKEVEVPEGCTYEMVSETTIDFDGNKYWQKGALIRLTVPEGTAFNFWATNFSCFLSDPWNKNGIHELRDIRRMPSFTIATSLPNAKMERTMDGTKYRYLSESDYQIYLSKEYCDQKGYYIDGDGWLVKMVDGTKVYVTAVTGWVGPEIPSDGAQIHNDLVGTFRDHTLMAIIAPHAFDNCWEIKTLYFKDTDANNYNAMTDFDFLIGDYAFANCPSLTEIKMMQYTTRGDNHWEALKPSQVGSVGANVFSGTPKAYFSTDVNEYQNYLSSKTWKSQQDRITVYNHTNVDFTTNGAQYSYMRNTNGEPLKNNADGHSTLMQTLRLWNADYEDFTASSLLATQDKKNIWYASIVGCDDAYLKSNDGTLRIYNDPGSYYNYKTIVIGRNAFKDNKELKSIEFWQTNGRSENSYSDLKLVIQNGAFKGCTNLKELRMFYYVQDGDDHWETLGPQDVIPGDNIFGQPSAEDAKSMSREEFQKMLKDVQPQDFKILVSPDRYQEFLNDPNWMAYGQYIEPMDFNPNNSDTKDFSLGGLTYGYVTSPGGIMQTSQTVSQDLSWWTAPRIAIEVVMDLVSLGQIGSALHQALTETAALAAEVQALNAVNVSTVSFVGEGAARRFVTFGEAMNMMLSTGATKYGPQIMKTPASKSIFQNLISIGLLSKEGVWASSENIAKVVAKYGVNQAEDQIFKMEIARYTGLCANYINEQLIPAIMPTALKNLVPKVAKTAAMKGTKALFSPSKVFAQNATSAAYLSSKAWGGTDSYNGDALQKGMRENILSNIHQVSFVGGGYAITTPQKNLAYHTYIKDVPNDVTDAVIYAGTGKKQGRNNNARTMTMAKRAFRDHTNLKTVTFHETAIQSDEALPMLFTIPDSAFVGCTNLQRLDLRVQTDDNGQQALGPESFILGGDGIFDGLDPARFHIIIDSSRKQDFLDNKSWKPLEQYFVYEDAQPKTQYQEYGGNYAYVYENGTTQKVNKVGGHKIEHTVVTGADNEFIESHQGALKLCNDIGVYNNYQLDAVAKKAFMGNQNLRVVNFTDLKGSGAYGDSYTGLQVALMDSCFADCKNLSNLDLLYLVTDGDNKINPIKPDQVTIGKGVLDGTTAKIKMMPQQVVWFEADSTWAKYKDRFLPCIIKPGDKGIQNALKPMTYYDMAHTGYDPTTWDEYIDLARIAGHPDGFAWLNGKFREQNDDIRSFADFKHFESVGLDYVGKEWFRGCRKMTNILLPKTIKTIQDYAFATCSALQEIELPAAVSEIGNCAFADCQDLKTILVRSAKPATLTGSDQFQKNEGLKIYVPAASVDAYKTAWAEYKDYIVSDATYKINKVVTVTKTDELAEKLGLFVEMSYSGLMYGDEPRYVHGNYAKYDSLTISGPLGNVDLAVIRYLAGCDAYTAGGKHTDGKLRYLNLYNADIKKTDDSRHYFNDDQRMVGARYDIKTDNKLPTYLFKGCTALETVVLPKSLTDMDARIFEDCSALKRVAIAGSLKDYDDKMYLKGLLDYPLEELVLVSDKPAVSERSNPWEQPIYAVFTKKSQLGDYLNQPYLTRVVQSITAPFNDDAVMETLAKRGQFFPSEYTSAARVENLFNDNQSIKTFDEFKLFSVKSLDRTFANASALKRISLPDSLKSISAEAFSGCSKLDTIRITNEKVPTLAHNAFASLPKDFRILVPKTLCKLYREQWAEYADHINVDEQNYADSEWTVVTLDKPNTLAEKLGFKVKQDYKQIPVLTNKHNYICSVRGDYSHIRKLKVKGPISGSDFAIMRYLAGFCPWSNSRNVMGPLEAIDLYDADIKKSDDLAAPDMFYVITHMGSSSVDKDNELPSYAFLQAYNLKSLVLPKTCTKINTRALQQCEALETLVLGDNLVDFDWSALDDDAMLTRLYIMAKKKPEMTQDNWLIRQLYNNYNPTFDAFYVRPSLYNEYLSDPAYTQDLRRTNLISKGVFDDDDSFCAFAAHAAATADDLAGVKDVEGWFDSHPGARDLTPLQYTSVDSLSKATLAPLTQLEQLTMPSTLNAMEDGIFEKNKNLRYVDFLQCNNAQYIASLRWELEQKKGINRKKTLVYMPAAYEVTGEDNLVVVNNGKLECVKFVLQDSLDYMVPHTFEAEQVVNTRPLKVAKEPYTVCLPYKMFVPKGAKAYKLSQRDANKLVFTEEPDEMEPMRPYLLKVEGGKSLNSDPVTLDAYVYVPQTIPSNSEVRIQQDDAPGYSFRGTFKAIGNAEAADLGAYILQSDGDWHPVGTFNQKASIRPFRAYLLPSARNAGARIKMSLVDNDEDATGIDTIETIDQDGTSRYYDLQGREIDARSARGIVIFNGKKVMKK